MVAPLIAAYAPYLPALGHQVLRYWPNITRFGGQAAAQANNLFRTISSGTQKLGQLMYSPPVSQSLIQQGPLLSPFLGAGVESFMMNSPKPPSPPPSPSQESPIPPPYPVPETFLNKKSPEDLKPKVDVPQAQPLETSSQIPPREPTDVEKFLQSNTYKFFQSDAYQKLKDLFAGMAESSSDGSGWDALASGVKRLNEGDKQRGQVNQTVEYLKSKGYSEEEARVMARNPQMLSALLTGGKSPEGFQSYTNPETGELEYRPVKGSMQELEYNQKLQAQKEWEGRRIKNMFTTKQQLRAGLNDLKAAFKLIQKGNATGFKGWFSQKAGGSDGYKLDQLLEGIRGGVLRTVFENLKSMSSSGTVGTGPISNFESQALSSMFGSLDVGRDKEGLERTLKVIKTAFDFFNRYNDLQLYNALTGQPIDTPQEISEKYFVDSPVSQGGSASLPIISSREELDRYPLGTIVNYNGYPVYKGAKR